MTTEPQASPTPAERLRELVQVRKRKAEEINRLGLQISRLTNDIVQIDMDMKAILQAHFYTKPEELLDD